MYNMFRPASRLISPPRLLPACRARPNVRFLSTAPPHLKSRSWKSSAARWGIAIAGIYYYNTSTLFAEVPDQSLRDAASLHHEDEQPLPTLASLSPSQKFQPPPPDPEPAEQPHEPSSSQSPQDLEDEAGQQGAFNEETGEINWDCPCLGGMAHGPCGEEFREAFSCFVYSKEEPKGMDCIEKFKGMQNCFREHPDVYGAELEEDEEEQEQEEMMMREGGEGVESNKGKESEAPVVAASQPEDSPGIAAAVAAATTTTTAETTKDKDKGRTAAAEPVNGSTLSVPDGQEKERRERQQQQQQQQQQDDADWPESVVPKAAHDAHDAAVPSSSSSSSSDKK